MEEGELHEWLLSFVHGWSLEATEKRYCYRVKFRCLEWQNLINVFKLFFLRLTSPHRFAASKHCWLSEHYQDTDDERSLATVASCWFIDLIRVDCQQPVLVYFLPMLAQRGAY